jgi:anti-sigma B factor antagonist
VEEDDVPDVPRPRWPAILSVAVERRDGVVSVALTGELDLTGTDHVRTALDSALDSSAEPIVVDLSGLTLLDVGGLQMLLDARARARVDGRALELVAPAGPVRRLFALAGREDELA